MVVSIEAVNREYEKKEKRAKEVKDIVEAFEEPFVLTISTILENRLNETLLKSGIQARNCIYISEVRSIIDKMLQGQATDVKTQFDYRLDKMFEKVAERVAQHYKDAGYRVWAKRLYIGSGVEAAVWTNDKLANENYIGMRLH